jgi:acetyltransferase-like isoleucine patch superfamily enzyme
MITEILIPRVNANEDKVLLAQILVSAGQYINPGTEVAVVETTKATHSIESNVGGWVCSINFSQGEMVAVGSNLLTIQDTQDEAGLDLVASSVNLELETSTSNPLEVRRTAKERLQRRDSGSFSSNEKSKTVPITRFEFESPPSEKLTWIIHSRNKLDSLAYEGTVFSVDMLRKIFGDVHIGDRVRICAKRIFIGENARIGDDTTIDADLVFIGDGVTLGKGCEFITGELILADGVTIGDSVVVDLAGGRTKESRLLIGPGSLVGSRVLINTSREVLIENRAAISPGSMIFTHSFWQNALKGYPYRFERVRLADDSWVGAGCQVFPGVTIGSGSVCVSNSTIVENVPSHTMVAGVPANVIRQNLGLGTSLTQERAQLNECLLEFWDLMRSRNCSVEVNKRGALVRLPGNSIRNIVIVSDEDIHLSVPFDAIVLNFASDDVNAFAVFNFIDYVFFGEEDRLVHSLRNFLRRLGIRFSPYSWRPDHNKEIQID